jgi:hypothetical protein
MLYETHLFSERGQWISLVRQARAMSTSVADRGMVAPHPQNLPILGNPSSLETETRMRAYAACG